MKKLTIQETAEMLKHCEDVHILIHRTPDGDCIGSGYSLQAVFRQLGIRSKVLCDDPIPKRFHFLLPEEPEEDFEPKCVISVDVAETALFGGLEERYGNCVNICIDHHISNREYAEYLMLEPDASSACEVLYKIYRAMGVTFTEQITKCLYTGIATDTGCFKYSCATPEAHIFTAEMMKEFPNIRYDLINREMFTVKSRAQLQVEIAMFRDMEFYFEGKVTLVWATLDICEANGITINEMEGLTTLSTQPEGVQVGITVREPKRGVYKISMRSTDYVNVSEICQKLGGGGHVKAAGCTLSGTMNEIREKLLKVVEPAL
ncbi:MAG: bifunctional oligoribonuclease/PAP phosphatase NrnA [Oscillospiraceae bacterium]